MKKHLIALLIPILLGTALTLSAQNKPIKGTGQLKHATYILKDFTGIKISGSWAQATIRCGEMPLVKIVTDENIINFIRVHETGDRVEISALQWIEPTNADIIIQLPYLTSLETEGWVTATITNLKSPDFVYTGEVGTLIVTGMANQISIKTLKGNIDLCGVTVNSLQAEINGRGNVRYSGNPSLIHNGVGEMVHCNATSQEIDTKTVNVVLYNNHWKTRQVFVRGPVSRNFSYGFEIGPFSKKTETWPVGTELFRANKDGGPDILIFRVAASDQDAVKKLNP